MNITDNHRTCVNAMAERRAQICIDLITSNEDLKANKLGRLQDQSDLEVLAEHFPESPGRIPVPRELLERLKEDAVALLERDNVHRNSSEWRDIKIVEGLLK